jgi:hypothetical protein
VSLEPSFPLMPPELKEKICLDAINLENDIIKKIEIFNNLRLVNWQSKNIIDHSSVIWNHIKETCINAIESKKDLCEKIEIAAKLFVTNTKVRDLMNFLVSKGVFDLSGSKYSKYFNDQKSNNNWLSKLGKADIAFFQKIKTIKQKLNDADADLFMSSIKENPETAIEIFKHFTVKEFIKITKEPDAEISLVTIFDLPEIAIFSLVQNFRKNPNIIFNEDYYNKLRKMTVANSNAFFKVYLSSDGNDIDPGILSDNESNHSELSDFENDRSCHSFSD